MTAETEPGVELAGAEDARSLLTLEEARNAFRPRASGGSTALLTPQFWPSETDFRLLASKAMKEYSSVVLSCQVCGNLFQQPQESNIGTFK